MAEHDAGTFAAEAVAWAHAVVGTPDLGDRRRVRRVQQLVTCLADQPDASIPTACGDWATTKAAYRLWATADRVPEFAERLRAGHTQATKAQLPVGRVLAVQDTTTLDWTDHPATTELGPIGRGTQRHGLLVHSTLALTTDGVPLGLLDQQVWARDVTAHGKKHTRRMRATAEKESQKWLDGISHAATNLPDEVELIHIGDAEADIYDLFAYAQTTATQFLIRACQDRGTTAGMRLEATLESQPVADVRVIELARTSRRAPRSARLELRWTSVTLTAPHRRADPGVTVDAILVQEVEAPAGVEPVRWLLLTTVPVTTLDEAWERVGWYRYRWRIERYHYVLKSGCQIETRQLRTAARLASCLALYALVAVRVLHLKELAEATPDAPGTDLVSVEEWQVLWTKRHPGTAPPAGTPTLRMVVRELAQLGGFLARRGDGEPGVKVIWRGLQRLNDLLEGYHLATTLRPGLVGNA